jgi:hypothetical protein
MEVRLPVFGRFGFSLGPFERSPDQDPSKARALRPPTPLAPGQGFPLRIRQLLGHRLEIPRPRQRLQRRITSRSSRGFLRSQELIAVKATSCNGTPS